MGIKLTVKSFAGAFGIIAAAVIPTALSAQLDLQRSPVPRYHLVQLSVDSEKVAPEKFKAETEKIRSCLEAKDLARMLSADMTRNRFVLSTRLPDELKDQLKELPSGHATQVFSDDGSTMRVLVLCYRV